jgi:sulfide:quinone oxidoreductase
MRRMCWSSRSARITTSMRRQALPKPVTSSTPKAGAEHLREVLPAFSRGHAIVGVTSEPFKCPPAPSEAALLLHDYLARRGARDACQITLVMPFGSPIPPAPAASGALVSAFAERGIAFVPNRRVRALDPAQRVAILDDESEIPFDLFLGIPTHRVPAVVEASGMTHGGWIPVDPTNLKTSSLASTPSAM